MDPSEFVIIDASRDYGNFTHPVLAGCDCPTSYYTCYSSTVLSWGFDIPNVEYSTSFYMKMDDGSHQGIPHGWILATG